MKTLNLIKPAILLLIATTLHTFTVNAQETKNVALSNFSGVGVSAGLSVYLTQGNTEGAKIVANDESMKDVVVEQNGSTVTVKWKEQNRSTWSNGNNHRSAKIYITYKKLNAISASSGSSVNTENTLKTDRLDLKVSSGATIKADISAKDTQLQISSGATASLNGNTTNFDLKASSGASVEAAELKADQADVKVSSGATAKVFGDKKLTLAASSGGNIDYKSNGELTIVSKSRSAGIRKIN